MALRDGSGIRPPRAYALDAAAAASGAEPERLPVAATPSSYAVTVGDMEQHVTLRSGVETIAGTVGVLGRGGGERVLRVIPGWIKGSSGRGSGATEHVQLMLALSSIEVSAHDALITRGWRACSHR